jgi:hypothetical protein
MKDVKHDLVLHMDALRSVHDSSPHIRNVVKQLAETWDAPKLATWTPSTHNMALAGPRFFELAPFCEPEWVNEHDGMFMCFYESCMCFRAVVNEYVRIHVCKRVRRIQIYIWPSRLNGLGVQVARATTRSRCRSLAGGLSARL